MIQRRAFIALCTSLALSLRRTVAAELTGVELAHAEMWRRFIDEHGIMIDFADLDGKVSLPTPEECREGKPNALGWWSPIENGPMFNGMYLEAMLARWQHSKSDDDALKARRLMQGLLKLNSISEVAGFVGRGVSTDGKSHHPMGSNDQTLPWFVGLWHYATSSLATEAERTTIIQHLLSTAEAIIALQWSMPAEEPFRRRGSFAGFEFDSAPRMLFVCKALHQLTKDEVWEKRYLTVLSERGGQEQRSRLEICEAGMKFHYAPRHSWTSCTCVAALRALWEMEVDPAIKAAYARGLEASADLAMKSIPLHAQYDNANTATFDMNWRMMNDLWKPHSTEQEAQTLAKEQLKAFHKVSPRRSLETDFVREPTAAAWVVSLAPDKAKLRSRTAELKQLISHYDYSRLYYSQFFWVECAWWRIKAAEG